MTGTPERDIGPLAQILLGIAVYTEKSYSCSSDRVVPWQISSHRFAYVERWHRFSTASRTDLGKSIGIW